MTRGHDRLIAEWAAFCRDNDLPVSSADDLRHHAVLKTWQRAYVDDFIKRWTREDALEEIGS